MGKRFRVAFSFAGEKRQFVESMAQILAAKFGPESILYDKFHEAEFARSDLAFYLARLYEKEADLVVGVFCNDYTIKEWCGLEWNAIYGLLKSKRSQDVMLLRFDHVEPEGLNRLAGFIDLDDKHPGLIVPLILQRLSLNEGKSKNFYTDQQEKLLIPSPNPWGRNSMQLIPSLRPDEKQFLNLHKAIKNPQNITTGGIPLSKNDDTHAKKPPGFILPAGSDEGPPAIGRIEASSRDQPPFTLLEIGRNAEGIIGQTVTGATYISGHHNNVSVINNISLPGEFSDIYNRDIECRLESLVKKRFFGEYDALAESKKLGSEILNHPPSCGSNALKSKALAWCARIQSLSGDLPLAEEFWSRAKELNVSSDLIKITEVFILCRQDSDERRALAAINDFDSPMALTAGLLCVAHHRGSQDAVEWMGRVIRSAGDLDADGKLVFLMQHLDLKYWDQVAQIVDTITEADYAASPSLWHVVALCKLLPAVPNDLRVHVVKQVPFGVKDFRLGSKSDELLARREAAKCFLQASQIALDYGCNDAAEISYEYALWLQINDPDLEIEKNARCQLKKKLDSYNNLRYVPMAIQFGICLDLEKVDRAIERRIAELGGNIPPDAMVARFALAFVNKPLEQARDYVANYHEQFADHVNPLAYIPFLAHVGLHEKAVELLDKLFGKRMISVEEERKMRSIISESQESDPSAIYEKKYKDSQALADLITLVEYLVNNSRWDEVCMYARRLFAETNSLQDAEQLVNALSRTNRPNEIVVFLRRNSDLLCQSEFLRTAYAWALYCEGEVKEAALQLEDIYDERNVQHRNLRVHLNIAIGNWPALSTFIENEYAERNSRSARELISVAHLALQFKNNSRAHPLLSAAAAKAGDDAHVLAAAYFMATNAGLEDEPDVFGWFEQAESLSGDEGPIRRMPIKGLVEQIPEWHRNNAQIWKSLQQGEMPIFVAGHHLNQGIIRMMMFPIFSNCNEKDLRRKALIPAYSGKRIPANWNLLGKTVGIDITALITLGLLRLLEDVFTELNLVYLPHSTLRRLFIDKSEASHHQPSRIRRASEIQSLVAKGALERFSSFHPSSSELAMQVGEELAALISEAHSRVRSTGAPHLVVRSAPVHRPSSFMEEEADLSAHDDVLSSCMSVVQKLRAKGIITSGEEQKAAVFLRQRERPWPNQPPIADGATLYLDELTTSYFQDLNLLGRLKDAGLRAVVSPAFLGEADLLLAIGEISEEIQDCIERIRVVLHAGLESGKVRLAPKVSDENEKELIYSHPSFGMPALADICDALISDDRFFNQFPMCKSSVILTTADLLDSLAAERILTAEALLEKRTKLRQSGYGFLPITSDELQACLNQSTVENGRVNESAELRAIRESILHIRMSDWIQFPEETAWLELLLQVFVHVLQDQWSDGNNLKNAEVYSDWLFEQIYPLGWAHLIEVESVEDIFLMHCFRSYFLLLDMPLNCTRDASAKAYWDWLDQRLLRPMMVQQPKLFSLLVERIRESALHEIETLSSEDMV